MTTDPKKNDEIKDEELDKVSGGAEQSVDQGQDGLGSGEGGGDSGSGSGGGGGGGGGARPDVVRSTPTKL